MPTEYYNRMTDKEKHFASLDAAAEIAEKASLISLERNWSIARATEYVRRMNPNLAEMEINGYVSEKPARTYSMSSNQAAKQLADLTTELMKKEKLPFDVAHARVFADEKNSELVKAYAFSE